MIAMRSIACFVALLCFAPAATARAECLAYDTPVTLEGTVEFVEFPGPPGYGEDPANDSVETQAILRLSAPLCVAAAGDQPAVAGQRDVTLVPHKASFKPGERVRVRGELFAAHSAHHRTPLLLAVEQTTPVP